MDEPHYADVQHEVHIVEPSRKLQLVGNLDDVICTIENAAAFFDGKAAEDASQTGEGQSRCQSGKMSSAGRQW